MEETGQINYATLPWFTLFNQTFAQSENLPSILARYGLNFDSLSKIAEKSSNSSEPYGRKILFKSDEIEVMLASWSFQASASPHNHGASKGLIWFVNGNFSEQHYRFQNRELVRSGEPVHFQENQVVTVDAQDIHSCCPERTGLSLHIYAPPIHQMKVWDLEQKKTLTVSDHCGAWVPKNRNFIENETAW